jgi:alkylation response protein AidB-like acyl-CoA dehydrogenase
VYGGWNGDRDDHSESRVKLVETTAEEDVLLDPDSFDLEPSPEQQQLCDVVRSLLERKCGTDIVRTAEVEGSNLDLWKQLCDMGLVDMALATESGSADLLGTSLICEILGATLAPVPLVENVASARLLGRLEGSATVGHLLAEIVAGTKSVTIALHPPCEGALIAVPAGASADHVIWAESGNLFLTSDLPPRLPQPNLGGLDVADRLTTDSSLLTNSGGSDLVDAAIDDWRTLTAAMLVGMADRSLQLGTEYSIQRHAFGVPIASFQAVAHRLADRATEVAGAQLLAWKAAWQRDQTPKYISSLPAMAFVFSAEVAERTATDVLHLHGGYGFMLEFDIQLYFRKAKALALLSGGLAPHLDRIGEIEWKGLEAAR